MQQLLQGSTRSRFRSCTPPPFQLNPASTPLGSWVSSSAATACLWRIYTDVHSRGGKPGPLESVGDGAAAGLAARVSFDSLQAKRPKTPGRQGP